MRGNRDFIIFALALAGLVSSQTSPSFAQARIGSAAAISNQVEGINRNVTRTLAVGGEIFSNEQVRTGEQATAQLVFLDNTNLNVGPKSTVTLDRFVYDPARGGGSVILRATRGLFRFVTGTQPPQDYKIVTPLATIGVRGTVFDLDVQPARVIVILESGQVTVTPRAGRAVNLNVPQTSVTVFASGRVEGPVAWHGTILETASNWQFPLVGGGVCPFGLNEFDTCLPAPSKVCQWGKTASGTCVNNRLAEITQTGTLVYSQLGINHNFSPYVPANPTAEKDYPIPINHFFQIFLNGNF